MIVIDNNLNAASLYKVKMKKALFNLKIDENVREEFRIAANLRGASMSGLIHQFIFKIIREEKITNPEAFVSIEVSDEEFKAVYGGGDAEPIETTEENQKNPTNKGLIKKI